MTSPTISRVTVHTYPVIEVFGPTIQGEGALAGAPTLFVRFGGCDYRCSWCDSMYAVDPAEVRANARKLTGEEILLEALRLEPHPHGLWVTFSGGNPALMDFNRAPGKYSVVGAFQRMGFRIAVETQGSIWRDWLAQVDHLTVSPKPPSSEMFIERHRIQTEAFLAVAKKVMSPDRRSMKIVVFDNTDLDYARDMFTTHPEWQHFLSAGTPQEHIGDDGLMLEDVAKSYRWLCEAIAGDPDFTDARVLCQMHVVAWGAARGV